MGLFTNAELIIIEKESLQYVIFKKEGKKENI
jgi:hypothetical protein